MELDELKKSWNALDEHLKDKKLVKDEEISQLINHATKNINEMSRLNKRLRIISLTIIALLLFTFIYDGVFPDIYYQIILIALVPALGWDLFSSRYLSNTSIDELPLVTVISRFNRIHRWVIRERMIGIGFILFMAVFFFFYEWKSHRALPCMMGDRICYQAHMTFSGRLFHDLSLPDAGRTHQKNRPLSDGRNHIFSELIL